VLRKIPFGFLLQISGIKAVSEPTHRRPSDAAESFPRIFVIERLLHHVYGLLIRHVRRAIHYADLNFASALQVVQA
jgi:hypothetical protein